MTSLGDDKVMRDVSLAIRLHEAFTFDQIQGQLLHNVTKETFTDYTKRKLRETPPKQNKR